MKIDMYIVGFIAFSMGEILVNCLEEDLYSRTVCMNLAKKVDAHWFSDNRTVNAILEWEKEKGESQ